MTRIKIAELRNNLSRILRSVEKGDTVEVLDRDRPIARIVPVEQRVKLRIIPAGKPFDALRDKRYRPLGRPGFDIVELLLEDRRKEYKRNP